MRRELAALELRRLSWKRAKAAGGAVAKQFLEHDLLTYSSAIAFQVLYAIVPLTMLALAALGFVHAETLYTNHVAPTLRSSLSKDAYRIANSTALRVMNRERIPWVTLGLAVTLWGAGAAVRSMMTPLNAVYGAEETRSWLRRIVESIVGGALAICCMIGAILIALLAPLWNLSGVVAWLFWIARWGATLALLVLAVAILLRATPSKKRPIQWISIGTAICLVCWIVATLGFAAYISAVSYSSLYGALAGVVLLLIYLHVSTIALLLGVVVDALLRELVTTRERPSPRSSRKRRGFPRARTAR